MRIGPIGWLALLVLLALPACSDGPYACGDPPCGRQGDAGPGAQADGGVGFDGGIAPPSGDGGGVDASAMFAEVCTNGVDEFSDQIMDCDAAGCAAVPFCCVGSSHADCCMDAPATQLLFGDCSSLDCADVRATFGDPSVEDSALLPDAPVDSGVVLGDEVEPDAERLTIDTVIETPGACDNCPDAIVVALGPAPDTDSQAISDVALMVRRGYGDIALVIANDVVATAPLEEGAFQYRLMTDPRGDVTVEVRPAEGASAPIATLSGAWSPRPSARLLLYGRTPDGAQVADAARAESIAVRRERCDLPDALRREAPPSGLGLSASVSVVRSGSSWLLAYELGEGIAFANSETLAGPWAAVGSDTEPRVVLEGSTLRDPELLVDEGQLRLYVTEDDGVARRLATAIGETDASGFGAVTALPVPTNDEGELSEPTVVSFGGRRLLAATRTTATRSSIVLLEDRDGVVDLVGASPLESAIALEGDSLEEFDDDGVGDPELVDLGAGVLGLYYTGRRGSRTAIGLRVSADTSYFRDVGDGPLLRANDVGPDALGASAPAVVVDEAHLHLFYAGWDGAAETLSRATRRTP